MQTSGDAYQPRADIYSYFKKSSGLDVTITHLGFLLELRQPFLNLIIAALDPELSKLVHLVGIIKQKSVLRI